MALPYQSIPTTSIIVPRSSNHDVRRFVVDLLQDIDADITSEKAWEMARKFTGNGYDALELKKGGWQKPFGDVRFNISTLSSFT